MSAKPPRQLVVKQRMVITFPEGSEPEEPHMLESHPSPATHADRERYALRSAKAEARLPEAEAAAKEWFAPEALLKALSDANIGFKQEQIPEEMRASAYGIMYWALKQGEESLPNQVMQSLRTKFADAFPDTGLDNFLAPKHQEEFKDPHRSKYRTLFGQGMDTPEMLELYRKIGMQPPGGTRGL